MPDNPMRDGIMLGVGVGVLGVFQSSMPKPPDLASSSAVDPATIKSIRAAEMHSLVGAAIIGTIGSVIVRSSAPFVLAAGLSVVMLGVNEWTLRR